MGLRRTKTTQSWESTACRNSCSARARFVPLRARRLSSRNAKSRGTGGYLPIYEQVELERTLKSLLEQFWAVLLGWSGGDGTMRRARLVYRPHGHLDCGRSRPDCVRSLCLSIAATGHSERPST